MKKIPFILCYDIRDAKRLARVHRLISRKLLMLQYSVYYGELDRATLGHLMQQLGRLIAGPDDVRLYHTQTLGTMQRLGQPDEDWMLFDEAGRSLS